MNTVKINLPYIIFMLELGVGRTYILGRINVVSFL